MSSVVRRINESPISMGEGESIAWPLDVSNWTSAPLSPSAKIFELVSGVWTDVTVSKMTGSPSVAVDVITLPLISGLESSKSYRLEVSFDDTGNTFVAWGLIEVTK